MYTKSILIVLYVASQIFPSYSSSQHPVAKKSVLAKIKEKRAMRKVIAGMRGLV